MDRGLKQHWGKYADTRGQYDPQGDSLVAQHNEDSGCSE